MAVFLTAGFTKVGSGTLILDGINSYTGLTQSMMARPEIGDPDHSALSVLGAGSYGYGRCLERVWHMGGDLSNSAGGVVAPGASSAP